MSDEFEERGMPLGDYTAPEDALSRAKFKPPLWQKIFNKIRKRDPESALGLDSAMISRRQLQLALQMSRSTRWDVEFLKGAESFFYREVYGMETDGYGSGLDRHTRYQEYDFIENRFAEVWSALNIYADECTQRNESGNVFRIRSDNPAVKRILEKLFFKTLNINSHAWNILRNMCKFGDSFAEIVIDNGGIKRLKFRPQHAVYIVYDLIQEKVKAYAYNTRSMISAHSTGSVYGLSGGSSASHGVISEHGEDLVFYSPSRMAHWSLEDTRTYPYGLSLVEAVRSVSLQMIKMEEAMMVYRLARAPERRVFFVDTRGIPPQKQDEYIKRIRNKIKTNRSQENFTGGLISRYKALGFDEDYFIPVRADGTNTRIDVLPGAQNLGEIEDVRYFQDRFYTGIGISKAYLGREEALNSRATLVQQDQRFAKKAARIQESFVTGCYHLAWVELAMNDGINMDEVEFTLEPTLTSYVDELSRMEVWQQRAVLARDLRDAGFIDDYYAQTNILKMDPQEVFEIAQRKAGEGPEGEATGGDGDFGAGLSTGEDFGEPVEDFEEPLAEPAGGGGEAAPVEDLPPVELAHHRRMGIPIYGRTVPDGVKPSVKLGWAKKAADEARKRAEEEKDEATEDNVLLESRVTREQFEKDGRLEDEMEVKLDDIDNETLTLP